MFVAAAVLLDQAPVGAAWRSLSAGLEFGHFANQSSGNPNGIRWNRQRRLGDSSARSAMFVAAAVLLDQAPVGAAWR